MSSTVVAITLMINSVPLSLAFQTRPLDFIRPHDVGHANRRQHKNAFTDSNKCSYNWLGPSSPSPTRLFLDDLPTAPPLGPNNPKKKNLKTFQRYLEIECWKRAEFRELEPVLKSVAESCKQINRIVQRAQTDDLYGVALGADGRPLDTTNVQGEVQQQLDVLCNTYMLRAFCGSGSSIHSVASEEEDEPRCCSDVMTDSAFAVGDYIAVFDPIDGSKNIDASLPVGSIFGIYKCQPGTAVDESTFLQDGRSLVAAGYCLFSATTVLVLTLGSGVDGFTLDPDSGRFLHTLKDIRIPRKGPIFSFNEANYRDFGAPEQRFLNMLKEGGTSTKMKMTARYIGALVADVHNILINGGIYGYPATRSNPNGKLRLLYECAPMAMIMEQAGGAASTGTGRVLDVKPTEIHQRTPVFLGSVENVFELDQFFQYYDDDDDKGVGSKDGRSSE
ncbi:fructose-1,6-bisphosphatase [Nitzschia inconspicua]|uniref:Fructose-1,6-bisphosphatase, cytosolic n=1 Tax=Nitzschia inconspicua TaxID=303405 RepID=A0A9K3K776_9STRA|nr:fructose-1,6-bisphosphatase [Nitzschia inconspicua]KAG7344490.1 fructose-1,6-bisphosphatase [Nitzschia inconspicua]